MEREWVSLESPTMARAGHGPMPCQGLYHRPSDARPTVAFIATHYNVDFSEHYLAEHLAERGYGFLGWNTRYRGNEAYVLIDNALIDIGVGVRWLREVAGVDTVVLLGNSGGGSLMAAYQSQATEPNVEPAPGLKLHDAVLELLPADLYVALNAHPGRPDVLTGWMDPSVVDEADPVSTDSDIDLFADGREAPYDAEFLARYRAAQVARNRKISTWAHDELARLKAHGHFDRIFNIHRVYADPRFLDLTIDPSDRQIGCYAGDPRRANNGPLGIGRSSTLRSWLSMWSLDEAQCNGAQHLPRVTVPSLVVQSLADRGVYPSDTRAIFDALGASDKQIELPPGEHYFEDGGRDDVADLIAGWLQDRHHWSATMSEEPEFEFRGVHHLALVSSDMGRTVDFYTGLLGMPLVLTIELPHGMGQHFFFDIGNGDTLAFFWYPDAPAAEPGVSAPAGYPIVSDSRSAVGSMNHIALSVPPEKFDEYVERLHAKGIETSGITNHDDSEHQITRRMHDGVFLRSVYFFDPDGALLELACWTRELGPQDLGIEPARVS